MRKMIASFALVMGLIFGINHVASAASADSVVVPGTYKGAWIDSTGKAVNDGTAFVNVAAEKGVYGELDGVQFTTWPDANGIYQIGHEVQGEQFVIRAQVLVGDAIRFERYELRTDGTLSLSDTMTAVREAPLVF